MKLSEYAHREGVVYQTAWRRYQQGKIPGAYMDDTGHIHVPSDQEYLKNKAVVYSRVSTPGQKHDLKRQSQRLVEFAQAQGLVVVDVVEEIASGVKDDRPKLTKLLHKNHTWGVLVVEHKDRLSRVGFGWFTTFLSMLDKEILVSNEAEDSEEGRMHDVFSILYSYAASEYGRRGAKNRAERAAKILTEE